MIRFLAARLTTRAIGALPLSLVCAAAVAGGHGDGHPAASCSDRSLQGTYAFYQYGEVIGQGAAADVGVLVADGRGSFTGSEVVHTPAAQVVEITFCNGAYEVAESCVGTLRWDAVVGGPCGEGLDIGERTATITIGREDVYVLSTTPGSVLVGIGTRR
jgi:hypothetical protein